MSDTSPQQNQNPTPLTGVRVWLSGSIPETDVSTEQERAGIAEFVKGFSARVFKEGGHIIHGSHPSFTPILLEQARFYQVEGNRKDCLTLAVSRYWSKDPQHVPIEEWRTHCLVHEIPEATGLEAREGSLEILRDWMAASCDVIVAVGGKWWQDTAGRSGVPREVALAKKRGVPCFLLGGLGGAAREFVSNHPNLFESLKNGLPEYANRYIATEANPSRLPLDLCSHLRNLPLVRGRGSDGASFRILALDGGGIKGAFTASVLATWEKQTGLRIVEHFDLIAGTSTGGILAIGLGLGLSAEEILEFYKKRGSVIFPITSLVRKFKYTVLHFLKPKYSQQILLHELETAFCRGVGRKPTLSDSKCRLLIPAYHAVAGSPHVFRTPHHPDMTGDASIESAKVALATAAAPTFFSAAKVENSIGESKYFDGGVWANSPVMAAIIEATCHLEVPLDRIDVLSVGTTEEPFTVRNRTNAGIIRWGKKLITLLMNAQGDSTQNHAKLLAGEMRYLRVNVVTPNGSYELDSVNEIEELASRGNLKGLEPDVIRQVKSRFLNGVRVKPWTRF